MSTEHSDYSRPRKGKGKKPKRYESDEEPGSKQRVGPSSKKPRKSHPLSSDDDPDEIPVPNVEALESAVTKVLARRQLEKGTPEKSNSKFCFLQYLEYTQWYALVFICRVIWVIFRYNSN